MKKGLFLAVACLVASIANAGQLVDNALITEIANTSSNQDQFSVKVSGGGGLCANRHIHFPASATQDAIYKRAYAAALSAMATKTKVKIHNYASDDCDGASYILLKAD